MTTAFPSVSVVVPALNAARTLGRCLQALAQLDPAPMEILLVDNGSTDESRAIAERFAASHRAVSVRVIDAPQRGASIARNVGVRQAAGAVIAFTDADCAPEPAWLAHVTKPFGDPRTTAVAGRVVGHAGSSLLEVFSSLYTLQSSEQPQVHRAFTPVSGGFPTANLAIRRERFVALNGFDEHVAIYGEDYDLCARIYAGGGQIVYEPAAIVCHYHRTSLRSLLKQAFGFGRSHAYVIQKHFTRGLWIDLPRHSLAWPGAPVRGWLNLTSADKKLAALLAASAVAPHLVWVAVLYVVWLAWQAWKRATGGRASSSPIASLGLACLLLAKSGAMTAGRWAGSLQYRVWCL